MRLPFLSSWVVSGVIIYFCSSGNFILFSDFFPKFCRSKINDDVFLLFPQSVIHLVWVEYFVQNA